MLITYNVKAFVNILSIRLQIYLENVFKEHAVGINNKEYL